MRKRAILVLLVIFVLAVTQAFAESRYTSNGAVITWGNTWLRVDNTNTNGVTVTIAVELSNGKIDRVILVVAGDDSRQWAPSGNLTIKEIRSINVEPR